MPKNLEGTEICPEGGRTSASHSCYLTEHKAQFIGFQELDLHLEVSLKKHPSFHCNSRSFFKTALEILGG